jgi:uncharacterized protein (TIRG00374 family)
MKWLKKMIVLGVILSILSAAAVLFYTSTEDTLPSLLAVKPIYLLAAVLLHVMSYGIWGYRISVLCRSVSEHVGIIKSTEIATSSLLMRAITPSSAGGEPTNNRAERALREHVVQRKIGGTLRKGKGTSIQGL